MPGIIIGRVDEPYGLGQAFVCCQISRVKMGPLLTWTVSVERTTVQYRRLRGGQV